MHSEHLMKVKWSSHFMSINQSMMISIDCPKRLYGDPTVGSQNVSARAFFFLQKINAEEESSH